MKKALIIFVIYNLLNFQSIKPNKINFLIRHVINSINNAESGISKLNNEILNLEGMSGNKVRHLLNNLCSLANGKYLEIGTWKGSTFISALYNNEKSLKESIAIDNWSQFSGPKKEFLDNAKKYLKKDQFQFIEKDCFNIDLSQIKTKINIYFYDGDHRVEDQKQAFTYFDAIFDDVFIAIIDDYNFMNVPEGTQQAFKLLNYKIEFEKYLPSPRFTPPFDNLGWWNGIYVAVISKTNK